MRVPSTLYKYRNWNDPYHKLLLTEGELFFASPDSFEDELDCGNPIRYDLLTVGEMSSIYESVFYRFNPNGSREECIEYKQRRFVERQRIGEEEESRIFNELFQDGFINKKLGVLSLTENSRSKRMWREYGQDHKGFCVGIDGDSLCKENVMNYGAVVDYVKYYQEGNLPIRHPVKDDEKEKVYKTIYSKTKKWEFEEEFRICRVDNDLNDKNWRKQRVSSSTIKEVILGAKMPKKHQKEIIDLCGRLYPETRIFQSEIDGDKVRLKRIK